jgi:hypothetical protein
VQNKSHRGRVAIDRDRSTLLRLFIHERNSLRELPGEKQIDHHWGLGKR